LYDRIDRGDVLREAWKRVRSNRGAAGVDGQSLAAIEAQGVEGFLAELQGLLRSGEILGVLGLRLHPDQTRIVELGLKKEGFVFLGCSLRIVRSHFKGKAYLFRWPSPRAMKALRARIRELTARRRWAGMRDIREVIRVLNPVLRGWGNYFRTGNASLKSRQIDRYVEIRLVRLLGNRGSWRRRPFQAREGSHRRLVEEHGLYQLLGTIRYPGAVHAR
jgi:RNA-directed DNA polymerase